MPSIVKNRELIGIYEKYFDTLYYQREETNIAGSFIDSSAGIETMETTIQKEENQKKGRTKQPMLLHQRT